MLLWKEGLCQEVIEDAPNMFHMGVLVQLADGRWHLIDPHMRSAGLMHNIKELDYLCDILDKFSQSGHSSDVWI